MKYGRASAIEIDEVEDGTIDVTLRDEAGVIVGLITVYPGPRIGAVLLASDGSVAHKTGYPETGEDAPPRLKG